MTTQPRASMAITPRTYLVDPALPPHVAEINALQSRLLLAWGRLAMDQRRVAVTLVEGMADQPPHTPAQPAGDGR